MPAGIILAGGLARRMGGGDKAILKLGGVPLADRVIAALKPQCACLVISANGDPARFAETRLRVIADTLPGYLGPLAGILSALDWLAEYETGVESAVSAPADTPFLPLDLAARLEEARAETCAVLSCASSGGRRHPLVALWPVAIRQDLRRALVEEGLRKVEAFLQRHICVFVEWPVEPLDPFFNINTPSDLAKAEGILGRRGGR